MVSEHGGDGITPIVIEGVTVPVRNEIQETVLDVGDGDWTMRTDVVLFTPSDYNADELADDLQEHVQAKLDEATDNHDQDVIESTAMQINTLIHRLRDRDGAFGGEHNPPRSDIP